MKVLLGVCGSIAAYKTFDLVRLFVNQGHEVKVVLSRGAIEFVRPQVFKYLGAAEVYESTDDFKYPTNEHQIGSVLHIELAKWADKFVVAPLSANTLSKFSHARADDLLSSIFLAIDQSKPILLFPAMNTNMLNHPFVRENISMLEKVNSLAQVHVFSTQNGQLACGDLGEGKLAAIDVIKDLVESFNSSFKEKKVVITTGATISPIDPVRFLTNASTGKTGYELAKNLLNQGFTVEVIAGKNAISTLNNLVDHPNFSLKRIITTRDMYNTVHESIQGASAYISAAAISDIEFLETSSKLKKSSMKDSLPILKAVDVLKSVLEKNDKNLKVIGFAAETDLSEEVLLEKWNRKKVDLLIGTHVHSGLTKENEEQLGFGTDSAQYSLMKNAKITFCGRLTKVELAAKISEEIANE
ncbi:bifunctional phosphopantothenoylcysteine decarboxylase/phosphopantothenate--cysteine ligase CoaBC [Halobacteriovorax sp. HLS]|uniref:bifunctional phosphopantothenoylcysteine decarboxylase/phosphopantothenate--cysteine ligase CoaBC n=1 Tax=Halobacteriovorax sp. HLS TaxID=2234000 RepID=UPI000FDAE188|nr:bifunctional phosphopantothenoylcysteine decarboxylase/phosphopantothenate--cysteine ligase CoaBC [Halobacteriovorax sp. HLS]